MKCEHCDKEAVDGEYECLECDSQTNLQKKLSYLEKAIMGDYEVSRIILGDNMAKVAFTLSLNALGSFKKEHK